MKQLKSVAIALFSSLWIVGVLGAANRFLIVQIQEHSNGQLADQAARLLTDARRDLVIGGVWLGLVVFYWAYRLTRALHENAASTRTGLSRSRDDR